jgi:hypothetical protein
MYQLKKMIYNCQTIYYMEFLPSMASFINALNNSKNSIYGRCHNFNFTKNSTFYDLTSQKLLLHLDNSPLAEHSVTLQEFALKGY